MLPKRIEEMVAAAEQIRSEISEDVEHDILRQQASNVIAIAEELTRVKRALLGEQSEIEEILAEALGYPIDGPGGPQEGMHITGDHTAVTLAMETASKIKAIPAETLRLAADHVDVVYPTDVFPEPPEGQGQAANTVLREAGFGSLDRFSASASRNVANLLRYWADNGLTGR